MFPYTQPKENDKIEALKKEAQDVLRGYMARIEKERQIERDKHEFNWRAFLFLVFCVICPVVMFELNHRIFPPTSIWSWYYWIK